MAVSMTNFKWLVDAIAAANKFKPTDWFGSANTVRIPSVAAVDLGVTLPQTGWLRVKFVDLDQKEKTLLLEEDLTNFKQVVKGVGFPSVTSPEPVGVLGPPVLIPVEIPGASVVFSTRWVLSWTPWRVVVEFKNVNGVRYRFDGKIPFGKSVSNYFAGLELYLKKLASDL